jgi:hypothetical protein
MVWVLASIIGGLLIVILATKGVEPSYPERQK